MKPDDSIDAYELDALFDSGADISRYMDDSRTEYLDKTHKRVNVDFPGWMVDALDQEAHRLGIPRQAVIKTWVADRLDARLPRHQIRHQISQ